MSVKCKIENLTDLEQEIIKEGCTKTLNYLLRACGEKGFYESKTGYLCYPICINEDRTFVCAKREPWVTKYDDIKFSNNGELKCHTLEINNGLLPKDIPSENSPIPEFSEAKKQGWCMKLKMNKRIYIKASCLTFSYSVDETETLAEMLTGERVDITDLPQEEADKIYDEISGELIQRNGYILGTNKIIVDADWVNYHLRVRHRTFDRFNNPEEYDKKIGLYKKNPLYEKLIPENKARDTCRIPVVCHKIFTTQSGLPIYDIDKVFITPSGSPIYRIREIGKIAT